MDFFSLRSLVALVFCGLVFPAISAEGVTPGEEISKLYTVSESFDPLGSELAGENVDLNSGQLSFRQTDVSLPGNGGLPVAFTRMFSPDGFSRHEAAIAELGDWRIDVPKIHTVLAVQHGWPDNRCSAMQEPPVAFSDGLDGQPFESWEYWHGYHINIPGKGSQELLNRSTQNPNTPTTTSEYPVVTKNHWMAKCQNVGSTYANGDAKTSGQTGEIFVVKTPDGLTYYFDQMVTEAQPLLEKSYEDKTFIDRKRYVLLATRVEDTFGNWVHYNYTDSGRLTSITSSDNRTITVSYNASNKVSSVTDGSNTWTYTYSSDVSGHKHLDIVNLPDGRHWNFNLEAMADVQFEPQGAMSCSGPGTATGSATGSIVHPFGATVSFSLAPRKHGRANVQRNCFYETQDAPYEALYPKEYYTLALISKTVTGPNMSAQTWDYIYSQTPGWYSDEPAGYTYKYTEVRNPSGGKVRYYFWNHADWREGKSYVDYYYNAHSGVSWHRQVVHYHTQGSFPVGATQQLRVNHARASTVSRNYQQRIKEGNNYFYWNISSFDNYDNPIVRKEFNSLGDTVQKRYTYENRVADWWLGQLKEVKYELPTEFNGVKAYEASYRPDGRIGDVWRFGRHVGTYTYHADGELHQIIDPDSNITALSNYYRGKPTSINFPENSSKTLSVAANGVIQNINDSYSRQTSYSYDGMKRLTNIAPPGGSQWDDTSFTLTTSGATPAGIASGSLRRIVQTGSNIETTYFDALLRPVLTERGSSYVRREFDGDGRKTFESYPSTNPQETDGVRYEYDVNGRPTRTERDLEGGGVAVETVSYVDGIKQVVTNARNFTTTHTYRRLSSPDGGQLIKIEAPEGQITTIARDGLGAMTSVTRSSSYGAKTRNYYYNSYRDLCMVKDPETGATVMSYNNRGLMAWRATGITTSATDCTTAYAAVPAGEKTTYTYDGKGRLLTTDVPGSSNDIVTVYDLEDNVTSLTTGAAVWNYTYNNRNMLETESLAINGYTFTLNPTYDTQGRVTQLAYPGGTRTTVFAPDAFGRPTRVGGIVSNVTYHPNDAVASYTYGNGVQTTVTQNRRGMTSALDYSGVNGWDYSYDANGNITGIINDGPASAPNDTRNNFAYDGLDRLTAVDAPNLWGQSRFTYDELDNIRYKKFGGVTQYYTYDANNRMTEIRATPGGTLQYSYGYDARGNIASRNSETFSFDKVNRMTASQAGGSYLYDGHGRRVKTTATDGEVTYSVYSQSGKLMQEYKPALGQRTDYVYLAGQLVGKVLSGSGTPGSISTITVPGSANGNFSVSWSSASNASHYEVQFQIDGGAWQDKGTVTGTSKLFTSPSSGTWRVRVAACKTGMGCGAPTTSTSFTVTTIAPSAPSQPSVSGVESGSTDTNGSFTVSWNKPAYTESFTLQRRINSGSWSTLTLPDPLDQQKSQSGLGDGSYDYRVRACNSVGCSAYSSIRSVTVENAPPTPTGLTSPVSSSGFYTVSWNTSSGATRYELHERQDAGSWVEIQDSSATSISVSRSTGVWEYRVRACKTVACSAWSATTETTVTSGGGGCDPLMSATETTAESGSPTLSSSTSTDSGPGNGNGNGKDQDGSNPTDDSAEALAGPGC